jgi:hypothetical protein
LPEHSSGRSARQRAAPIWNLYSLVSRFDRLFGSAAMAKSTMKTVHLTPDFNYNFRFVHFVFCFHSAWVFEVRSSVLSSIGDRRRRLIQWRCQQRRLQLPASEQALHSP